MHVLGLDLGNAKLKACWIDFQNQLETAEIRWDSQPIPVGSDRPLDFAMFLNLQIRNFLDKHELQVAKISRMVVCCSHSLSYPTYDVSIQHLAEILLKHNYPFPIDIIRADGVLTPVEEIAHLASEKLYAYAFTNFYGSAYLAQKMIQNGLSLDLGTTTLDIIPIKDGEIDPIGLSQPENYLRYRYTHGQIHWLGLTITPLTMLADRIPLGNEVFQVIPRQYRSDLIFALSAEADRALMGKHAYGNHFPSEAAAYKGLSQYVGLDPNLLSRSEIHQIRDYLFEQLLQKVATEIRAVAEANFEQPDQIELCVFALGESLLLRPALERAGFNLERLQYLKLKRSQHLWSASSVFAMALKALEKELERELDLL